MPRLVIANDFPAFAKFIPTDSDFTCIHPAPSKGFRRCQNHVNIRDRDTAADIHARILSSTMDSTMHLRDDDLQEYAELCCCVRWHRAAMMNERVMTQLVYKWRTELLDLRDRELAARRPTGPSTPILQPTTVQTSPNRVTRSHTDRREMLVHEASPIAPRFEPYKTNSRVSMFDLVSTPLTEQQQGDGHLYCCSRPSDPGFYKAGCTKSSTRRSLDQRVQRFQTCSGRLNPVRLELSIQTTNVHRAERLVHNELQDCRRGELHCLDPSCFKKHREWFEVDVNAIKRVMSRWAQWMNQAKPYDDQGRLRTSWRHFCANLEREGTPITSSELYLAWLQGLVQDDNDDSTSSYSSEEESSSADEATHEEAVGSVEPPEDPNGADCPICLDLISRRARTACGHEFCSDCIAHWFEAHNRCPMCRTELVAGDVEEAEVAEIPMQNTSLYPIGSQQNPFIIS